MSNEELIRRIQGGEHELMGDLYTQNTGFIQRIIRGGGLYPDRHPEDFEDAMQDAYFGLYEAVRNYDESKGYKFLIYAKWYIRQAVKRRRNMPLDISEHTRQEVGKIKRVRDNLTQQLKRRPTATEISRYTKISVDRIDYLLNVIKPVRSIYEPVSGTDNLTAGDCIQDDRICFEDEIAAFDEQRHIREVVADLPDDDRRIIELFYFDGMTQTEIAEAEGISISQVRQQREKAMRQLRRPQYSRRLLDIDERTPYYRHVGVEQFNNTWTSSIESIVLERERLERELIGRIREGGTCHEQ